MRCFLEVEFLLVPLHLLRLLLSAVFSRDGNANLFLYTLVNIGFHFIHIAGLRYGGRQWPLYTVIYIGSTLLLVTIVHNNSTFYCSMMYVLGTLCPLALNALVMLWRKPRWESNSEKRP